LGGGPAGAAAARWLAILGRSVVLIEKSPFPRPHIGESLTGGVLPLLDVLELRGAVENAGFLRPRRVLLKWAGKTELHELDGPPGFQVDRCRFDSLMLDAAQSAGVRVFQPARATEITPRTHNLGWNISVQQPDGKAFPLTCEFLIDATGRASGGKRATGAATVALYAYWTGPGIVGDETRVEAGPSEWYWGAPVSAEAFNASVFVDKDRYKAGVAEAGSMDRFYRELIHSSELLRDCLKGRCGDIRTCDATSLACSNPIDGHYIKIGEAAFTIDPLSSQGVQTSIGSALHAAAVIHTMIEHPDDSGLARDFYVHRQQRAIAFHASHSTEFYAQATTKFNTPFWIRRSTYAGFPKVRPPHPSRPEPGARDLVGMNPQVSFANVAVLQDAFITAATGVILAEVEEPVVFATGTKIVDLLRAVQYPLRYEDILRTWQQIVQPAQAVAALRLALRLGIVRIEKSDE
jgi:flavin-dependent dehydrogenase